MTRTRAAAAEGSCVRRARRKPGGETVFGTASPNSTGSSWLHMKRSAASRKVHFGLLALSAAEQTPGCRKHPLLAAAAALLTHDCMRFLENAAGWEGGVGGGAKNSVL